MGLTLPFNNQPASQDFGNEGSSYTPPSGKYARVVVTMNVSASGIINQPGAVTDGTDNISASSNASTATYWIEFGETIAATATIPSATGTAGAAFSVNDAANLTVTIGGNQVAALSARATASGDSSSGSGTIATIVGDANVDFAVHEYNELT